MIALLTVAHPYITKVNVSIYIKSNMCLGVCHLTTTRSFRGITLQISVLLSIMGMPVIRIEDTLAHTIIPEYIP